MGSYGFQGAWTLGTVVSDSTRTKGTQWREAESTRLEGTILPGLMDTSTGTTAEP